ncbi:hypothetical protein GCM10009714_34710 [Microlunatus capsulatus]
MTSRPGTTGDGLVVLASARSALEAVELTKVAVLLAAAGSVVSAAAVAVLLRPPAGAVCGVLTVTVRVAPAPTSRVPTGQVTVRPAVVQPAGVPTTAVPSGRGSVMTTARAWEGPALVVVRV